MRGKQQKKKRVRGALARLLTAANAGWRRSKPAQQPTQKQTNKRRTNKKALQHFRRGSLVICLLVAVAAPLVALAVQDGRHGWSPATTAAAWAPVITAGLLALLAVVNFRDGGLLPYVRGKDGRLSTSATQVALWTVMVVFLIVYFTILKAFDESAKGVFDEFRGEYLILLGGPFAAYVIARFATQAKIEEGELQKVGSGDPRLTDIVKGDDGTGSLTDTQYFLFNLTALVYAVVQLVGAPGTWPRIPDTLVALTGASAATYVAKKAVATNKPVLLAIAGRARIGRRGGVRPGATVEIFGANFAPAGSQSGRGAHGVMVLFGHVEVEPSDVEDDLITVVVPDVLAAKGNDQVDVQVRTAAGAISDSYPLTLAA